MVSNSSMIIRAVAALDVDGARNSVSLVTSERASKNKSSDEDEDKKIDDSAFLGILQSASLAQRFTEKPSRC